MLIPSRRNRDGRKTDDIVEIRVLPDADNCAPCDDSDETQEGCDVNVREIMSERPVWVAPETDVVVVALRMSEHELGALPVCEHGRLVGIITDRDIVFRYLTGRSHEGRLVAHYMTRDPITVEPDQSLEHAQTLMSEHHLRRLPVCQQGRLVGMIAQGDLARCASRDPVEHFGSAPSKRARMTASTGSVV